MNSQQQLATLLLRVSLGAIYLAHGLYLKVFVFTLPGTAQYFESLGLPGAFAYLVFAGETLGGLALLLGFQVRLASAGLVLIAAGATWFHLGSGWLFSNAGGGWEFPAFLAVATLVQGLLGSGPYALKLPARSPALAQSA